MANAKKKEWIPPAELLVPVTIKMDEDQDVAVEQEESKSNDSDPAISSLNALFKLKYVSVSFMKILNF